MEIYFPYKYITPIHYNALGEYIKSSNATSTNHAAVNVGEDVEFVFHLQDNGAATAKTYSSAPL